MFIRHERKAVSLDKLKMTGNLLQFISSLNLHLIQLCSSCQFHVHARWLCVISQISKPLIMILFLYSLCVNAPTILIYARNNCCKQAKNGMIIFFFYQFHNWNISFTLCIYMYYLIFGGGGGIITAYDANRWCLISFHWTLLLLLKIVIFL